MTLHDLGREKGNRPRFPERPAGCFAQMGTVPFFARWLLAALAALAAVGTASPALAHKLSVFATAEGRTIRGRAYLQGGGSPGRAAVSLFDPQGQSLGQTTTDEQGKFTVEARFRCDHRIIVDSGEGHRAEYTLPATALPDDLPLRTADEGASAAKPPQAAPLPSPQHGDPSPPASASHVKLEDLARQIDQLQFQIDQLGSRIRVQDVLGGLGYILGLMGLAYYFLGVRRKLPADRARDQPRD